MTTGDNYNVACPYCGKINHPIMHGNTPGFGCWTEFPAACFHCGREVAYHADWAIRLRALRQDELTPTKEKP